MKHYLRNNTGTLIDLGGFEIPPLSEVWFFDDVSFIIDDNLIGLINFFEVNSLIKTQINSNDLTYKVDALTKTSQEFYDFFHSFKEDVKSKLEPKNIYFTKNDVNTILLITDEGIKKEKIKSYSVDFVEFVGDVQITGTNEQVYLSLFRPDLPDGDYIIEASCIWNRDSSNSDIILNLKNYGLTVLPRIPQIEPPDSGGGGNGGTDQAYDFFIKKKVTVTGGIGLALDFSFSGSSNDLCTVFMSNIEVKKLFS